MGTIVVSEFVSLDMVMEAPGGEPGYAHSGWVFPYQDGDQMVYKLDETLAADALLLGRRTYESFAGAWPEREDGQGFARKMNTMPKYVVTSSAAPLEWNNSTALGGAPEESVRKLKADVDGEILVAGSRTLVHALLRAGLVDELRLMVFPVVLGSGARVFPDSAEKMSLELVDDRRYHSGVQVLTYHPIVQ